MAANLVAAVAERLLRGERFETIRAARHLAESVLDQRKEKKFVLKVNNNRSIKPGRKR